MILKNILFDKGRSGILKNTSGDQAKNKMKILHPCGFYLITIFVASIILCNNIYFVSALSSRQPNLGSNKVPEYISNFVVIQEGEENTCRFSLKDEDYSYTTAAGTVTIKILDSQESILYENTFTITKSDFGTYTLVLTGEDFIAYVWSFNQASVEKGFSPGKAVLEFRSGGWLWTIEQDWITIPEFSEEEIQAMYEEEYQDSKISISEIISKHYFELLLESVGLFTYRPYSWSDEETVFRIDITVRNIDTSSRYFFASDFVIIDDLWNQYDGEYYGTFEYGEIYPGVIRKGYLTFPSIHPDASSIRIIYTYNDYPDDIIYEFILDTSVIIPKESSEISCTTNKNSLVIGNTLTISGAITPLMADVPVTLTFIKPDFSFYEVLATTSSGGSFSYNYEPDTTGSWAVKASWDGNNQYSGSTSSSRSFTVTEKQSSSITCSVSSSILYAGNAMQISGIIMPGRANVPVLILITDPDSEEVEKWITTNSLGQYSSDFSSAKLGLWRVLSSWSGDSDYLGAMSNEVTFSVDRMHPTLMLTSSNTEIIQGNSITLSGSINPIIVGANISLKIINPENGAVYRDRFTTTTGTYTDTITPTEIGQWQVVAIWQGNDYYYDTESEELVFSVIEPPLKGSLIITVSDESGTSISGASISSTSHPEYQEPLAGTSNLEGSVRFSDIVVGTYNLLITKNEYQDYSVQATVGDSEVSSLNIQLIKQRGTIKIIIRDNSATLLEGVEVTSTSQPSGQTTLNAQTDDTGSVTFEDIKFGSYTFFASKDGYESSHTTLNAQTPDVLEKTLILELEPEPEPEPRGIPGFNNESVLMGIGISIMVIWMMSKRMRTRAMRQISLSF